MSRTLEILRQRVKESGLTMRAIDTGCGVAPSSLSRFINGKGGLSLKSAESLTAFLNKIERQKAKEARQCVKP